MSNNIIVEFLSGHVESLPSDTPVYVESWADCHGARAEGGSMRPTCDLIPAGTLGDPDTFVDGRALSSAPFTYYVAPPPYDGCAEPIEIVVEGDAL